MIEYVFTDLDGTLLNSDEQISKENIKAIEYIKQKGVGFGIASGRAQAIIEKITKKYGINDLVDVMIGTNGVELSEEGILQDVGLKYLKEKIILDLYHQFKDYEVAFIVHDGNTMISSKTNRYTDMDRKMNHYDHVTEQDFEQAIRKDYPRLLIVGDPLELNEIAVQMNDDEDRPYHFFKSYAYFLEIVSKQVSKGGMLELFCKHKGIALEQVLAIGDNDNDIEMIKLCGFGIAVENATKELKEHAKYITASNNDAGFAQAIYQFIK